MKLMNLLLFCVPFLTLVLEVCSALDRQTEKSSVTSKPAPNDGFYSGLSSFVTDLFSNEVPMTRTNLRKASHQDNNQRELYWRRHYGYGYGYGYICRFCLGHGHPYHYHSYDYSEDYSKDYSKDSSRDWDDYYYDDYYDYYDDDYYDDDDYDDDYAYKKPISNKSKKTTTEKTSNNNNNNNNSKAKKGQATKKTPGSSASNAASNKKQPPSTTGQSKIHAAQNKNQNQIHKSNTVKDSMGGGISIDTLIGTKTRTTQNNKMSIKIGQDDINLVTNMGFSSTQAQDALKNSNGDVQNAIEYLLSGNNQMHSSADEIKVNNDISDKQGDFNPVIAQPNTSMAIQPQSQLPKKKDDASRKAIVSELTKGQRSRLSMIVLGHVDAGKVS